MQLKRGKYQHYKGNFYEVIDCARHSETEEWFVVYKTCYGDYSTWVRPYELFTETVIVNGKTVPRFAYIGTASTRHSQRQKQPDKQQDADPVLQALNESMR